MADADWRKYRRMRGRDLPDKVPHGGVLYRRIQIYKHDFYAATGLYARDEGCCSQGSELPRRFVLKIYHPEPYLSIRLKWLARWLCDRESNIQRKLEGIDGIPVFYGSYGEFGFIREHIEGENLREYLDSGQPIPSGFFSRLTRTLRSVRERNITHNDLHKPENILVRADGSPVMIDFQIATHWGSSKSLMRHIMGGIFKYMSWADLYHLRKNQRRFQPGASRRGSALNRKGIVLTAYGWLSRPYRFIRHHIVLKRLMVAPSESLKAAA